MFDKEAIQIVLAAFHSEGAELNQDQAEFVLRNMVDNARRCLPKATKGLSDMEVLWMVVEASDD